MSDQKRFDEITLENAETAAKKLLEQPEIGSVAIIIGWEIPGQSGLPSGVWIPKDEKMSMARVLEMQQQLLRVQSNTIVAASRVLDAMAEASSKEVDTTTPKE